MSHRRNPSPLGAPVEWLEARAVPAGNVTAFVAGGTLVVVGDDDANQIRIGQLGSHTAAVGSLDGSTTVNGQPGPVVLDGVKNGLDIRMGGGDDVLAIDAAQFGPHLLIDLGDGNDTLVLANAKAGPGAQVAGGAGDDTIRVGMSKFGPQFMLGGQDGNDDVAVAFSRFGPGGLFSGGTGTDAFQNYGNRFGPHTVVQFAPAAAGGAVAGLAPVAVPDAAPVVIGTSVTIPVAANDLSRGAPLDPASVAIIAPPASGSAAPNPDGTVTYTHPGVGFDPITFTYTIRDTSGRVSNPAVVTVTPTATG